MSAESVEARDVQLGKDGSKWRHNYVPVNAVAVAMKAHRWKPSSSTRRAANGLGGKDRSKVVELPHLPRTKGKPTREQRALGTAQRAAAAEAKARQEHADWVHAQEQKNRAVARGETKSGFSLRQFREDNMRNLEADRAKDNAEVLRKGRAVRKQQARIRGEAPPKKIKPDTPARAKAREEIAARDARTIDTAKLRGGALSKHGIKEGTPAKFHIPAETKFEPHPYHAHSGGFPMHGQPERTLYLKGSTNMANVAFTHDTNTGKVLGLGTERGSGHYLHPDTKAQIEKAADSSGNPHFHRDAHGNVIYSHWQEPTGTSHTVREAEDRTGHVWHVGSTSIIVASKHPKTGAAEFHTLNYRPSRGFDQARRHDSGKDKAAVEENMRRHAQSIAEMRRQEDYDQKHGRDRRSIAERLRAADVVSERRLAARKKKAS